MCWGTTPLTGDVILQSNSNVGVENGLTLAIDGPVQDYNYDPGQVYIVIPAPPATFTKVGGGTLALSQSSTYTGTTFVKLGVLNIQNATALARPSRPRCSRSPSPGCPRLRSNSASRAAAARCPSCPRPPARPSR